MFTRFKLFTVIAVAALTASSLAAPKIFYSGDEPETVIVAFNDSQDAQVSMNAESLFDARDLIRLEYGTVELKALLRVKQVIAPEGISITLDDSRIETQNKKSILTVEFEISNDDYNVGSFPVTVILENTETSATFAIKLLVLAQ
jgi:hypothetical protein